VITARSLVLGFAFVAPLISLALIGTNVWLALAPIFVSHMLMLYATLVPASQWWGPVYTSFATTKREVWITIDDGPTPAHTLQFLEILKQFDARATFFVIGEKAEQHPHLVTEILAHGHTLANHTHTHPSRMFWCTLLPKIVREIDSCAATLRTTAERPAEFFRAPVGMKNPFVHPVLARRGLRLIGWTVRALDTVLRDPARVAARVEKRARPGAIIVLHEGRHTNTDASLGPRCLELTLQRLAARGYRFVIPAAEQLRTRGGGT
jgi:peptidoglycan/xylan/chitin deacetylase (PgdA/CDA1 family)